MNKYPSVQPVDWSIKINKKERRLAVATALQSAAADIIVARDVTVRSVLAYKYHSEPQ